jgi:DNA excision repair protein ERCC-5
MGVTGLWTVVAPTARPTQLATLNRKRLAVDASIWIYQFLKAVRDKEGNALRNSHVVGFFRRICKLLYFGIKPVFVFDGGAPILKRETVRGRARRREGRREDAARTAGKLLALQVARAAEEEDKKRKAGRSRHDDEDEEIGEGEELVYVDEIGMTQKERQLNRGFKRRDQYHLPDLDVSIESMGAPNDPRIMSQAELEEYARQFHTGEEINLYDFSKIDFESPFFLSLPPSDRYNILNAARLRSRLRMGYSKQQLDGMFPDRMAFSRFQIERVKERNELTQRLMHINGMAEDYLHQGGRIAGEKGKEYVLVKNEGVEGGWALGVVSNKGKARENAIDLDEDIKADSEEPEDDDEDFEDVAIEGLNRLPKMWPRKKQEVDFNTDYQEAAETIARRRKAVYEARQQAALSRAPKPVVEPSSADVDTLFMPQPANGDVADDEEIEELFEDVDIDQNGEEDDLQKAIAMSLEQPDDESRSDAGGFIASENDSTARQTMPKVNSAVNSPEPPVSDGEEGFDLQAALAESRKSKYLPKTTIKSGMPNAPTTRNAVQPLQQKFGGPLPFESLNLGQSLLGKKKSKMVEEDMSGGFERDLEKERQTTSVLPLPSWFNAAPTTSDLRNEVAGVVEEDHYNDHVTYGREEVTRRERILRRVETQEVIDVDAPSPSKAEEDIIPVESSDDEMSNAEKFSEGPMEALDKDIKASSERMSDAAKGSKHDLGAQDKAEPLARSAEIRGDGIDVRMDDITDIAQAEPPPSDEPNVVPGPQGALPAADEEGLEDEELVQWSESDIEDEDEENTEAQMPTNSTPTRDIFRKEPTLSQSPDNERLGHDDEAVEGENDFEDVAMPHNMPPPLLHYEPGRLNAEDVAFTSQYLMADEADAGKATENLPDGEEAGAQDDEEYISDSDEELFRQLAIEAEEHARFASSLNNKTPAQAAQDYENELKRLRSQQKKDRRDADEVTQTMVQECQALLRLFGLPYITAPMEAEAQCAELVRLGLVDGIVTDDSDIFLFGGTRIYKNMFNAAKFVECYLLADLEREYALDRRKLIRFAHLLGSDYTEGIPGIGPVSALEILTDFDTLEEFKEWCSKVQLGRPQDLEHQLSTPFRRKFRNTVQKRLFLPPSFPDIRVDQAYLQPEVDSDPEPFQWGVPDLDKLRSFLMATIGWSQERTDEILVPVIRTLNQQEKEGTQANITHFFSGGVGVGASKEGNAPRNRTGKESRRLKNAYTTLKGKAQRVRREADGDGDGDLHATPKGDVEDGSVETGSNNANDVEVVEEVTAKQMSRHKKRAKAKAPTPNDYSDDETEEGDFAPKKGRKKRRRRVADG